MICRVAHREVNAIERPTMEKGLMLPLILTAVCNTYTNQPRTIAVGIKRKLSTVLRFAQNCKPIISF